MSVSERRMVEANRSSTPHEIKNKILEALANFNRSNWHDDVTLLILAVS